MNIISGTFRPFINFIRIYRDLRGLLPTFLHVFRYDDLKVANFMGRDENGNRYYENSYYFFPRNRWVIYANKYGFDYDGSYVTPMWHAWLHHQTDELPCNDCTMPQYCWMLPQTGNQTGTKHEYVPFSTTRPKIEAWKPPKCKSS